MRWLVCLLLLLCPASAGLGEGISKPSVVSLDYCADQFVLGLTDRDQILAVSKDAEKPFSALRAKAAGLPKVRASAEDVVALAPDLVIRSYGGDARALALYERFGVAVHQIGYAASLSDAAAETRRAAEALGQSGRLPELGATEAVNNDAPSGKPAALYLTPGGATAGDATLVGDIMRLAGLKNAAGAGSWQSLPLETLVLDPPDLAITAFFGFDDDRTSHWSLTRHAVMREILADAQTYALDEAKITCPTWLAADEMVRLRSALEAGR